MMAFEWMTPDEPTFTQIVYVRQPDGRYRVNIAGTEQATIITRNQLIDLLPDVSLRATVGCDAIWDIEAEALFGEMGTIEAVAV